MGYARIGDVHQVSSRGIDTRERRPGVPMETSPRPLAHPPVRQATDRPSVVDRNKALTPVYGTAVPPRALSGLLRRLAYRIPEYKARRWMLLMLADRVDVLEHTIAPRVLVGAGALTLGVLAVVGARALRRR